MTEEGSKRLRHGENELPVREVKENLVCQVLCDQQRPLLTARWAQVETLARKRSEVIVTARRVCAPDARDPPIGGPRSSETARRSRGCAPAETCRMWRRTSHRKHRRNHRRGVRRSCAAGYGPGECSGDVKSFQKSAWQRLPRRGILGLTPCCFIHDDRRRHDMTIRAEFWLHRRC